MWVQVLESEYPLPPSDRDVNSTVKFTSSFLFLKVALAARARLWTAVCMVRGASLLGFSPMMVKVTNTYPLTGAPVRSRLERGMDPRADDGGGTFDETLPNVVLNSQSLCHVVTLLSKDWPSCEEIEPLMHSPSARSEDVL